MHFRRKYLHTRSAHALLNVRADASLHWLRIPAEQVGRLIAGWVGVGGRARGGPASGWWFNPNGRPFTQSRRSPKLKNICDLNVSRQSATHHTHHTHVGGVVLKVMLRSSLVAKICLELMNVFLEVLGDGEILTYDKGTITLFFC